MYDRYHHCAAQTRETPCGQYRNHVDQGQEGREKTVHYKGRQCLQELH